LKNNNGLDSFLSPKTKFSKGLILLISIQLKLAFGLNLNELFFGKTKHEPRLDQAIKKTVRTIETKNFLN
jgi:hypothetical protein